MNLLRQLWATLFPHWKEPPRWANFFDARQYQKFLGLVDGYFRKKKQPFQMGDGVVHFGAAKEANHRQQFGLTNLAQICGQCDEKDWAGIIHDHFHTLQRSQSEQEVLSQRLGHFDRVKELLSVRLWPEDYLGDLDREKFIHRIDVPGTLTTLVYDLPSSIRNVTPDEADVWDRSQEELFEIGLENVMENCIPDITQQDVGNDVKLTLFSDESFFVASHALLLDRHSEVIGPFGTLVGIPHRHVLLAFPIEDMSVVHAINAMIPIILGMEKEGPGSISAKLYWYQEGEFTELPYEVRDKTLAFTPPGEFVEVMQLLADRDGGSSFDDD